MPARNTVPCDHQAKIAGEAAITRSILRYLKSFQSGYVVKLHGGPYQQAGLPDILFILDGKSYFFEIKRPGGKLTKLQELTLAQLARAGASVCVAYNLGDVKQHLEGST